MALKSRSGFVRLAAVAACSWSTLTCGCGTRRRIEFYNVLTEDDLPAEVRPYAEAAVGGPGFFVALPCPSQRHCPRGESAGV